MRGLSNRFQRRRRTRLEGRCLLGTGGGERLLADGDGLIAAPQTRERFGATPVQLRVPPGLATLPGELESALQFAQRYLRFAALQVHRRQQTVVKGQSGSCAGLTNGRDARAK